MRLILLRPLVVFQYAAAMATLALASSQPITVQEPSVTLRGTLNVPDQHGRFPIVLVIPGSGPINENGDTVGASPAGLGIHHSPYLKIAQGLSVAGFAVARMNKRGLPPSTGSGGSLDTYVRDAHETLELLRQNPLIDPNKIVVLGHSEGGLIALQLATQERLQALILAGTPGRPLRDVITEQVLDANRRSGASEERLKEIRKLQEGFYDAIRAYRGSGSLTYAGQTFSEDAAVLLKSMIDVDPLELARQVRTSTLVLQGEEDVNVAPAHGRLLVSALPKGQLALIPDMSHVFTVARDRSPDQLHTTPQTDLHPRVIPTVLEWLKVNIPP